MAVTVQLMQSPCVLTSKALSVTFSPSSGCSRLLGVGVVHGLGNRGGVSGPGSLLRLTSRSSWGVLGARGRLAGSPSQLVPYLRLPQAQGFLCTTGSAPAPGCSGRSWLSSRSHVPCSTQPCGVSPLLFGSQPSLSAGWWEGEDLSLSRPILPSLPSTQFTPGLV